jgi:cell division protein FtsW
MIMSESAVSDSTSLEVSSNRAKESIPGRGIVLELQLWVILLLLMGVGWIMIYSASGAIALKKFSDPAYFMKRHFLYSGIGIVTMVVVSCIPYRWYKAWLLIMMTAALTALIAVLVPGIGVEINNARRWFQIKSFSMQPAEYAKVVWIIYLSVYLSKKEEKIRQFSVGFLPPIILCGIFCFLILLEPDFGTPFMIGVLTVSMLALGGVPWRYLLALGGPALLIFYQFVYRVPYRWERIIAFRNPWVDPFDSGYQLIQAWIAVGSGGIAGKGLGAGQQKLFFLPEPYTDFILAVIGEELGFLGILTVVVLFVLLFWTGFRIVQHASDFFGGVLALGLTMLFSLQALINMGVVLGLFPTKGLTLPFISYGGSAFTANCLAAGILLNIARNIGRKQVTN